MAITLSVELNDKEQERLLTIAQSIDPTLTPAQVKAWAEKTAKRALREYVIKAWTSHQNQQMDADWVSDNNPLPGTQIG